MGAQQSGTPAPPRIPVLITRGLKLSFLRANDELYANLRWQPTGSYHVLATAYDDHELYKASRTDAKQPQPLFGAGQHQPMLWTVDYGKAACSRRRWGTTSSASRPPRS